MSSNGYNKGRGSLSNPDGRFESRRVTADDPDAAGEWGAFDDEETARRLFVNEPGVIVICCPRKGVRVYRTLRIPESVHLRVVTRFTKVA